MKTLRRWSTALVLVPLLYSTPGYSYSVLTHEQVVDLLWKDQIEPLLVRRFPNSSPEELRKAHAYAYGGCVIQDMGYYPLSSDYFSDLVHYVRSGDFVLTLIKDSSDLNEYAFALGSLAHYASDNQGHPIVNRVVAIEFPKLQKKFGDSVTYAQDHKSHIQTEFGFDMAQVAKNRYTSDRYHDFIGFEVSKPLLQRAFYETYGLKLEDVFGDIDLAIGSYRRAVSKFIPAMTRVALLSRHDEIVHEPHNYEKRKFLYYLSRAQYEHEWGKGYRKPGVGSRILAFFLKLVPKVGPFKAVQFKIPTTQTENMYITSVNNTVEEYHRLLKEQRDEELTLRNLDFDTGKETQAGEYVLADETYAQLLDDLSKDSTNSIPSELRTNIIEFFSTAKPPTSKKETKRWEKLQKELARLKATPSQDQPSSGK